MSAPKGAPLTPEERSWAACPYYQAQNGWRPTENATCGPRTCVVEPECMYLGPGVRLDPTAEDREAER